MADYFRSTFTFEGKRYFIKGKTQREADQKAALKKAQLEAGVVAASAMTVARWWDEYIEVYKAGTSARTLELYRGIYKVAIGPYIGPRPLKSVRSADLQRIMNNLSTRSESYAKKARFLIVGLFKAAVENDLIPKSPAAGLRLPETAEPQERRALTMTERTLFLNASESCGQPGLFFRVMYFCGLRPSEVCRIRFEDFDREARVLHVRGTKTKAATRDVPVPLTLELPEGSGLMFLTKNEREPSKTAQRHYWRTVTRAMSRISGEPVAADLTPYCLRHDYCTRLQEVGVPIDVARRLMGHSSVEITSKIYTHASEIALEAARKLIDGRGGCDPERDPAAENR